jgi:hypothetical protein
MGAKPEGSSYPPESFAPADARCFVGSAHLDGCSGVEPEWLWIEWLGVAWLGMEWLWIEWLWILQSAPHF